MGKGENKIDTKTHTEQPEAEKLSPNRLAGATKEMMVPHPKNEKTGRKKS